MDPRRPTHSPPGNGSTGPKPRAFAAVAAPSPALPKGGGAIRGLGEKLFVNMAKGTCSFSVPVPTSPARSGFGPDLHLTYHSGAGNSPFGVGWQISLDQISRKTEKGLPNYDGSLGRDVFLLSGADDLVPALGPDGTLDQTHDGAEVIRRYRPRTEDGFARIEQHWRRPDGVPYWKVISRDNVVSIYGRSEGARIADPAAPERVFAWLLEERFDDRGNTILFEYKAEDRSGAPYLPHEGSRRAGLARPVNRYLKRVLWGNTVPWDGSTSMFELVADFGEHDVETPTPDEVRPWPCREDTYSNYRAGFDIRTYRLCRRLLMFHHVRELGPRACLVRSLDLEYDHSPVLSRLVRVTESGYTRDPTTGVYTKQSLPARAFGYSLPRIRGFSQEIDDRSAQEIYAAPKGTRQWNDLESEGLPGVLLRRGESLFYKQNLGGGELAPARQLPTRPSLSATGLAVFDIDGDGKKEMVFLERPMAGYYRRTDDGSWDPYRPFGSQPTIDWGNPHLQFIDFTGDGRMDVIISHGKTLLWYPSLGADGYGPPIEVRTPLDEDRSVVAIFASNQYMMFLADMTGDGLLDLVRVRNSSICYWPNQGYGRFGAKVEMTNAPLLDYVDQFDPRRVRLGDLDGSGTADLIYIDRDCIQVYINQSGNSFSKEIKLPPFPDHSPHSTIEVFDLVGTGTACIVWSTTLLTFRSAPVRFIDVLDGQKPYLLTSVKNDLGAETRIQYAPSTKLYLADRKAGRPWLTRLPFPVQVVERVETFDHVSRVLTACEYRYRDGHFDGVEREFTLFAQVEQIDGVRESALFPEVRRRNQALFAPPVRTVSRFRTGDRRVDEALAARIDREAAAVDPEAPRPRRLVLPDVANAEEERQARWATRGQLIRQEVYWLDGSPDQDVPTSVVERGVLVRRVQPAVDGRRAAFFVAPRETVTLTYERSRAGDGRLDPRTEHDLALEIDPYGTVRKSVALVSPRRQPSTDPSLSAQGRWLVTLKETDVLHLDGTSGALRLGVLLETRTWQLHGLTAPAGRLSFEDVNALVSAASARVILHEQVTPSGSSRRLIGRMRVRYCDRRDPTNPLPFGTADLLALPYERYALALTPGLIAQTFNSTGEHLTPSMVTEAGYVRLPDDDGWWRASGREIPDPARFYLPAAVVDPFGGTTTIEHDGYALFVRSTRDALGNETRAEHDYRMLAPFRIADANGNRAAVRTDALGMVIRSAVMGKERDSDGDTLESPTEVIAADLSRFAREGKPGYVHIRRRERHGDPASRWQEIYVYFDGRGNEILRKSLTEPGPAPVVDDQGHVVSVQASSRWVATGRRVFDNRGDVVQHYENYFSMTSDFEDDDAIAPWGVGCVFHHDANGRVVCTDYPDGTSSRTEIGAWRIVHWDQNDTVLDPGNAWFAERQPDAAPSAAERRVAVLTAAHAGTPSVVELDPLGREIVDVADLGGGRKVRTLTELDIEGNPLRVVDARGNEVERNVFDLTGRRLVRASCDAGERRMLPTVLGLVARAWDSRGFASRVAWDVLHRATHRWIRDASGVERLDERTVYGEAHPEAAGRNLRERVFQRYDSAGVVTYGRYDFKGNMVENARRLATSLDVEADWSALGAATEPIAVAQAAEPLLEAEDFAWQRRYDALNRVEREISPDGSETQPAYNLSGLRERVDVKIRGAAAPTKILDGVDYNAKGQRERIVQGGGIEITLTYDPRTFRAVRRRGVRPADGTVLQDLGFTFDPVGNVVAVRDGAQQSVFFDNAVIEAHAELTYDALYRLTEATGREHAFAGSGATDHHDTPVMTLPHPNDGQAVRRYAERYEYDDVGNPLVVRHLAGVSNAGSWTRRYAVEPGSNRLAATSLPGDRDEGPYSATYAHDAHGNVTRMPHLAQIDWDAHDRMRRVDLGGGGEALYRYDAEDRRVRKVIRRIGTLVDERIYLGNYEIYRQRDAAGVRLERQTLHVMDGDQRVAMIETKTVDREAAVTAPVPRIRYQLDNHLGSALLEADERGQVISYEEYSPYGTSTYRSARSAVEVSVKRYRYTGKERDEETGLYYHGARYYAPWLGRWTAADPIGIGDGVNAYRYAHNSPVRFFDPNGMAIPYYGDPFKPKPRVALKGIAAAALGSNAPDAGEPVSGAGPPAGAAAVGWAVSPGYTLPPAPVTPPPTPPTVPGGGVGPGALVGAAAVLVMLGAIYLVREKEETVTLYKAARPPEPPHRPGKDTVSPAPAKPQPTPAATHAPVVASVGSEKSEKGRSAPSASTTKEPRSNLPRVRDDAYTASKHLMSGKDVQRDLRRGRDAHVFDEAVDLLVLEDKVWKTGARQADVRGFERFIYKSDTPIGRRMQAGRPDVPLYYVEIKGRIEGDVWKYHLVPRSRPASE